MAFLEEYKHLKIKLEHINSATDNFGKHKLIGTGGFGRVYKGELSLFKGRGLVAFKRLDGIYGQGEAEFSKEITTLSRYTHDNLISLLGFCYEGPEKILVYEYAFNGSLDQHLNSDTLTWRQRLKICLQTARALEYLHDPRGTHQRVIHCDIKSGNILLDSQWNAKLSDLGLSKMGPANQAHTFLISSAVGTIGYCDPLYLVKGFLTKESDVYSFGVLLFEVLSGKLCYDKINNQFQILVPMWKEAYEQNRIEEIVFQDLIMQDMDHTSLKIFSDIAYRCLKTSREERPTMTEVVSELRVALETQEFGEGSQQLINYEEITKTAEPGLKYRSIAELKILMSKGVLLNGGNAWVSIDKYGGLCEFISIAACLPAEEQKYCYELSEYNSKFAKGIYNPIGIFKAHVRTQFLSPSITYTVNLVFKYDSSHVEGQLVNLKYRLEEETKTLSGHYVDVREDGWLMLELYQFTSDRSIVDLNIMFDDRNSSSMVVEGIEFRPLEKVEDKETEDGKSDVDTILDSDANWEEKLPTDYADILNYAKYQKQWRNKKELYSILCDGFILNYGEEWFFLDKNGMKCLILSARAACKSPYSEWLYIPESRFRGVYKYNYPFEAVYEIKSQLVSSETTYATYLVYKTPQDESRFLKVQDLSKLHNIWDIKLVIPQTPVIKPKPGENTHNPLNRPKVKGLPQERSDGWMEVKVWQFQTGSTPLPQVIPMALQFNGNKGKEKTQ